jgi:hypothetical protein
VIDERGLAAIAAGEMIEERSFLMEAERAIEVFGSAAVH